MSQMLKSGTTGIRGIQYFLRKTWATSAHVLKQTMMKLFSLAKNIFDLNEKQIIELMETNGYREIDTEDEEWAKEEYLTVMPLWISTLKTITHQRKLGCYDRP
jgi:hypothetical protein